MNYFQYTIEVEKYLDYYGLKDYIDIFHFDTLAIGITNHIILDMNNNYSTRMCAIRIMSSIFNNLNEHNKYLKENNQIN